MYNAPRRRAFSLVELSIVLVILGLLVGGVLSGQALIRASELRAVTAEYMRYKTAVGTFRDKYFALPGDMTNATAFWGTAGTCPGALATPSTTSATCNGDGNGTLAYNAPTANEYFRFWQHLANAGLIEGNYSGVTESVANDYNTLPGFNSPKSKMTNAGWSAYNPGATVAITDLIWYEGNYGNVFAFGSTHSGSITDGAVLKPEEAWNIDTKLDDGLPGTGGVRVSEASGGVCGDTAPSNAAAIAGTSKYLLSNSAITCDLIFTM